MARCKHLNGYFSRELIETTSTGFTNGLPDHSCECSGSAEFTGKISINCLDCSTEFVFNENNMPKWAKRLSDKERKEPKFTVGG